MAGPKTAGTRVQYGESGGAKTKDMHIGGAKSDLTVKTTPGGMKIKGTRVASGEHGSPYGSAKPKPGSLGPPPKPPENIRKRY